MYRIRDQNLKFISKIIFKVAKLFPILELYLDPFRGELYSKFSFGEVHRPIYGHKFSFMAMCDTFN